MQFLARRREKLPIWGAVHMSSRCISQYSKENQGKPEENKKEPNSSGFWPSLFERKKWRNGRAGSPAQNTNPNLWPRLRLTTLLHI